MDDIQAILTHNPVVIFSKKECTYCDKLVADLDAMKVPFIKVDIIESDLRDSLIEHTGCKTVPQLFIGGKFIGGYQEFAKLCGVGKIEALLAPFSIYPDMDF